MHQSSSRPQPRAGREGHTIAPNADEPAGQGVLPDKDFLLSALRAASLRAKLASTEMDSIGVALKRGLVSTEEALTWLHDENLFDHVIYRPFKC